MKMPEDTLLQLFFFCKQYLRYCCCAVLKLDTYIYPQWNRGGSPEIDPFYHRANRFYTVVPDQEGGSSPVTRHIEWEGPLYPRMMVNPYLRLHSHTNFYFQYFTQTSSKKTRVTFMSWGNSFLHISQKGQQQ